MSNLAKTLWLAVIAGICGIGLFFANSRSDKIANKNVVFAQPKFSLALLEEKLRTSYPDFHGIRSIQIGLAQTTTSPSVQLHITDSSGNHYFCLVARTSAGWTIEQLRRIKGAAAGSLI